MVEKSRPVLVPAFPQDSDARALAVVAPPTSQIRGGKGEVDPGKLRWLPKASAVNVQGMASFDHHLLTQKRGTLSQEPYEAVKTAIRELLSL